MSEGEVQPNLDERYSKGIRPSPKEAVRTSAQMKADALREEKRKPLVVRQAEEILKNSQTNVAKPETITSKGPDLVFSSTRIQKPDGSFVNPREGLPDVRTTFMSEKPRNDLIEWTISKIRKIIKK